MIEPASTRARLRLTASEPASLRIEGGDGVSAGLDHVELPLAEQGGGCQVSAPSGVATRDARRRHSGRPDIKVVVLSFEQRDGALGEDAHPSRWYWAVPSRGVIGTQWRPEPRQSLAPTSRPANGLDG